MRKPLVAGNWKMHGTKQSVQALLDGCLTIDTAGCDVAFFVSFVFMPYLEKRVAETKFHYGGQTMSEYDMGAYTGETSGAMLKAFGATHVLVGHSERRALFGESDEIVAKKFKAAQSCDLIPVLCIGETQAEREAGDTEAVVAKQLDAVIDACGIEAFQSAVIAYEPVWAIGTGLTATPDQAQAVHAFIRTKLSKLNASISDEIRILYGGSVKPVNAGELFAMQDIDGGLVGGASLKADDFIAICEAAA